MLPGCPEQVVVRRVENAAIVADVIEQPVAGLVSHRSPKPRDPERNPSLQASVR